MTTIQAVMNHLANTGEIEISSYDLPWLLGTANVEVHGVVVANGKAVGVYRTGSDIFKPDPAGIMMIAATWPQEALKALD